MVQTLYCVPGCNPDSGHMRACPRWDQNTAKQKSMQLKFEAIKAGGDVPDAEYEETMAVETNGHARALPPAPAKSKVDRLFEASLRIYLHRIEKGIEPSRTMAAECVDTARILVSEVERES